MLANGLDGLGLCRVVLIDSIFGLCGFGLVSCLLLGFDCIRRGLCF